MKRVFPCIWLGGVALFLIIALVLPRNMTANNHALHAPSPEFFLLIPVVMLVFGFVLFRRLLWNLADSVDDARDYLLVRRAGIEQRVLLSNVVNVSMSQFVNPPRLTLRLRKPGPLGDEIAFIPKLSGFRLNPFRRNEIAEDLMQRVDSLRHPGIS